MVHGFKKNYLKQIVNLENNEYISTASVYSKQEIGIYIPTTTC